MDLNTVRAHMILEDLDSEWDERQKPDELFKEFHEKFKRKFTKEIYGRQGNCNMGSIDLFMFIESKLDRMEKYSRELTIHTGEVKGHGHSWVEMDGEILDPTGELQFGKLSQTDYKSDGSRPTNNPKHIAGWGKYASLPEDQRINTDSSDEFDYETQEPK